MWNLAVHVFTFSVLKSVFINKIKYDLKENQYMKPGSTCVHIFRLEGKIKKYIKIHVWRFYIVSYTALLTSFQNIFSFLNNLFAK